MAKSEPSLADLARASKRVKGPRSEVAKLAAQLQVENPKLFAEFVAAVNDPTVPGQGLSDALKARGYELSGPNINRWRLNGGRL